MPLSGPGAETALGFRTTGVGTLATEIAWSWTAVGEEWVRDQDGATHVDSAGARVGATNVIVRFTPYVDSGVRDSVGAVVPEAAAVGEGDAWLLSGGRAQPGLAQAVRRRSHVVHRLGGWSLAARARDHMGRGAAARHRRDRPTLRVAVTVTLPSDVASPRWPPHWASSPSPPPPAAHPPRPDDGRPRHAPGPRMTAGDNRARRPVVSLAGDTTAAHVCHDVPRAVPEATAGEVRAALSARPYESVADVVVCDAADWSLWFLRRWCSPRPLTVASTR